MSPDSFPQLLGLTNTDEPLVQAIMAHAEGDPKLTPARIHKLNTDFVILKKAGVVLSFITQESFSNDYGPAKGTGPRVLSAVFYYPDGSEEVDPYSGKAPLADGPVQTREAATEAYGTAAESDGDDDAVEWEQWVLGDLEISADYDEDFNVLTLTVALPMLF